MDFVFHILKSIVLGGVFTFSALNPFSVNQPNNIIASPSPTPVNIEQSNTVSSPDPVIIEQPSPTPKVIPVQQNTYVNPDPVISCSYQYLGTQQIRRSLCNMQFECQIGDKWYFYTSREKCKQDQDAYWKNYYSGNGNIAKPNNVPQVTTQTNTEPLVTCVLSYGTYQIKQSDCDNSKKQDPSFVNCKLSRGTFLFTQKECEEAKTQEVESYVEKVYNQYSQEEQRKTNLSNCLIKAKEDKDRMMQWEATQNSTTDLVNQQIERNWGQAENQCHASYGY